MHSKTTRTIVGLIAACAIAYSAFRIRSGITALRADAMAHPRPGDHFIPDYVVPNTEKFKPKVVIPKRFPTITKFDVKNGEDADSELNPTELVLGVEVNGEARAYPINMMTGPRREIINDQLGNSAIAATW